MKEYIKPITQAVMLSKDIAIDCYSTVISSGNLQEGFRLGHDGTFYFTVPSSSTDDRGTHYSFQASSDCMYKFMYDGEFAECGQYTGRCEYNISWSGNTVDTSCVVMQLCAGATSWSCVTDIILVDNNGNQGNQGNQGRP